MAETRSCVDCGKKYMSYHGNARCVDCTSDRQKMLRRLREHPEEFCRICKKPLTGRQVSYCSKKCKSIQKSRTQKERAAAKKAENANGSVKPVNHCIDCGAEISYQAKRCPECSKARQLSLQRERRRMLRGEDEKTEWFCPICGKEFVQTSKNKNQIYCSEACGRIAWRKKRKEREALQDSMCIQPKNQAKDRQVSNEQLKKDRAEICAEARAAGMSYGKYVALKNLQVLKGM